MTSNSIDPGWNPQAITESIAPPGDPWHDTVAAVPRHMFTPRWWEPSDNGWTLHDGPALAAGTPGAWSAALDDDHPVVTKVGGLRAEDADPGNHPVGPPAIASPAPGDTLALFEYADVRPGCTVLLADAGTGYECALLGRQLGDAAVTALADDGTASRVRLLLRELSLSPAITARPTGACDRLISAVPGTAVPADCFAALRPGGRLSALLPAAS